MLRTLKIYMLPILMLVLITGSTVSGQTRIRFAKGKTSARITGSIAANGQKSFVARANRGQKVRVNWTSGNGRVYECETDSGGTGWDNIMDHTGDFTIDMCNTGRATTFVLIVSIR